METLELRIGTVCMGIGLTCFLLFARRAKKSEHGHFLTLVFVTATAMASYMAMALGQTHAQFVDGHATYIARYVDWLITTPLLLVSMAYLAAPTLRATGVALVAAVGADAFMILTGLAGAITSGDGKWAWFALSCAGFAAMLFMIWGDMRLAAINRERSRAFNTLAGLTTMLWMQYPFVFALGEEGVRLLSPAGQTAWFAVLDVLAKVAFGFISISYMATFPDTRDDASGDEIPASGVRAVGVS